MPELPRSLFLRYGAAVASVALATAARWWIDPSLGNHLPFVTYFVAVLFTAWYGGFGPSLVAIVIGALAADYFFVPPRSSWMIDELPHRVGLSLYFFVGLAGALFSEALQAARRRIEESSLEMARNREWLKVTLSSIGDAVIATDTKGRVTFLNAVAQELTGWTQEEAEQQPLEVVFRIVNEQSRQPVENPVEKVLREGSIVGLANHTVLLAKGGGEIPIDDSAAPIQDKQGNTIGVVLIFRDVTERRRAEETQRRLAAIVESSDDAIVGKSLDGTITSWNAGAERLYGYTAAEMLGKPFSLLVPPDRTEEVQESARRLAEGERLDHFETVRRRKDGSLIDVSVSYSPIKDSNGLLIGTAVITRDITERKRIEEELRGALREKEESLALLDTLQHNAPLGFAFVNRQFRYVRINEALAAIDGTVPKHHLGRTVQETVPKLWPRLEPLYRRALERGEPVTNQEVTGETPAAPGQPRHWLVNYYPVRVADEILGVGILVVDITERKRLEQELRLRIEQLADADRRKDEFLATLAHELRNPLAPIRTGMEVLKMSKDDPQAMEEVEAMMERQIEQLITLVDDLLDVSRITRGKFQLRRTRVALEEVIRSAVEAARPFIDEGRHELTVALPEYPIHLDADPHRLAQVVSNLLNNAAKYTPEGGHIWLSAERQGSDVALTVKDTGIGIPAEKLESVFEMFTQIDRPMEQGSTGLGIGLTLVKRLVEMHGGRVDVRSDGPNQGSEFSVHLPILIEPPAAATESGGTREPAPEAARQRVLIVDDNKAAADTLGIVVEKLGHEIRTARDGQEAFEVASEFLPDVVLMDLGMPRMNGYDAARRIREQPWGQQMVLVALTGWGQEEDRRRTKEAGFDHHLVKPADPAELQQLLIAARQKPAAHESGSRSS